MVVVFGGWVSKRLCFSVTRQVNGCALLGGQVGKRLCFWETKAVVDYV